MSLATVCINSFKWNTKRGGESVGRMEYMELITQLDAKMFYSSFLDMQDFSQMSSKMVTEVLMLEMKMAPAAKAYLISGFPRSMRDVVEYSDKVM